MPNKDNHIENLPHALSERLEKVVTCVVITLLTALHLRLN